MELMTLVNAICSSQHFLFQLSCNGDLCCFIGCLLHAVCCCAAPFALNVVKKSPCAGAMLVAVIACFHWALTQCVGAAL